MTLVGIFQTTESPVRFEVFTAVTKKNGVFWDVTPCCFCKNRRFGLCISSQRASVAGYGYVSSSPILGTLIMEALSSSETSVLTRATRPNVPEDTILLNLLIFSGVTLQVGVSGLEFAEPRISKEVSPFHETPNLVI
jgi:hypothetical protein